MKSLPVNSTCKHGSAAGHCRRLFLRLRARFDLDLSVLATLSIDCCCKLTTIRDWCSKMSISVVGRATPWNINCKLIFSHVSSVDASSALGVSLHKCPHRTIAFEWQNLLRKLGTVMANLSNRFWYSMNLSLAVNDQKFGVVGAMNAKWHFQMSWPPLDDRPTGNN